MERNANYALVGLSSLLLFIGLLVFVVWLARFQFARDFDTYDVLFVGPVRGLNEGGEVHFNGIKVGEVTTIELDRANTNRVIARVRINSDVPVRTDSRATLEPQGITGVNYVQVSAGTQDQPLLKDTVAEGVPVILSQSSAISDLLAGGGTVLTRAIEALDRVSSVLSDDNIKAFSATVRDVQGFTAELNARKTMIADTQIAMQNIGGAAKDFSNVATSIQTTVDGDGRQAIRDLAAASRSIKDAAESAEGMIGRLEGPTGDFAATGLPQLSAAIVTLQEAAESLDRLVGQVEQNPRGLVSKAPAKQVEVQP
jgi:phospholipid/cholesterol/gamma-HCH transport system substrate-binding protein